MGGDAGFDARAQADAGAPTDAGDHHSAVFLDVLTGTLFTQWNPVGENIVHIYDSDCSAFAPDGRLYRRSWSEGGLHAMNRAREWSPVNEMPADPHQGESCAQSLKTTC